LVGHLEMDKGLSAVDSFVGTLPFRRRRARSPAQHELASAACGTLFGSVNLKTHPDV
jgi:hypothetical protein